MAKDVNEPKCEWPRQFTLGSLLWLIYGVAVYLATIATFWMAGGPEDITSITYWGIVVCWGLLTPFYIRHGLIRLVGVHCGLPILFFFGFWMEGVEAMMVIFLLACFITVLIGFPWSLIVLPAKKFWGKIDF